MEGQRESFEIISRDTASEYHGYVSVIVADLQLIPAASWIARARSPLCVSPESLPSLLRSTEIRVSFCL